VESPEVENNLGFSLSQKKQGQLEALEHLDKAIVGSKGELRAALFNRAYVRHSRAVSVGRDVNHREEAERAVADIRSAIRQGSGPAEFHVTAARIFAMAEAVETESAVEQLELAVEMGRNPATFANDPMLNSLRKAARFQTLCQGMAIMTEESRQFRLVEPRRP